jgi:predicted nucleic acid-binding Zn ribbon protein
VKQKMSDPPLSRCARCGGAVTKVISASAIMFKGSGWYVTDYSDKLKPSGEAEPSSTPAAPQKETAPSSAEPAAASPAAAPSSSTSGTGSGSGSPPAASSPSSGSSSQ